MRPHEPYAHTVTTAQPSLSEEQSDRVRRYLIMMAIRICCVFGAILTPGVTRWVLIAGAVVLPYFAVVVANTKARRSARPATGWVTRAALPPGQTPS